MKWYKKWFSVRNVDSHYIVYFLGLHFHFRHKVTINWPEVTSCGVESPQRKTPRLVASLTSFPRRYATTVKVIGALLNQTLKPDQLVLYLAEEENPGGIEGLPKELVELQKFGLTIRFVHGTRSYTKLVPALRDYPEDVVMTFDDDIFYDRNTIKDLYESYLQYPQAIQANRVIAFRLDARLQPVRYRHRQMLDMALEKEPPSLFYTQMGVGGVLYPPHCLHESVFDEAVYTREIPSNDDVYFWAQAARLGTPVKVVGGFTYVMKEVAEVQAASLRTCNTAGGTGLDISEALPKMLAMYPEIIGKLQQEIAERDLA